MRPRHLLLALPLFALLSPAARGASATPPDARGAAPPSATKAEAQPIKPTTEAQAYAVVEKQLVKPLVSKEGRGSRFSRAYLPPQARRVRVLDHQLSADGRGGEFVAFAVDERSGSLARRADDDTDSGWRKDAIVGCVYPARDEIFIKRGDRFFGAGLLLGHKTAVDEVACRATPTRTPEATTAMAQPRGRAR
jgi:hypothetical protein